jgi:hypothetical protein
MGNISPASSFKKDIVTKVAKFVLGGCLCQFDYTDHGPVVGFEPTYRCI